jgi:hypothetical protein
VTEVAVAEETRTCLVPRGCPQANLGDHRRRGGRPIHGYAVLVDSADTWFLIAISLCGPLIGVDGRCVAHDEDGNVRPCRADRVARGVLLPPRSDADYRGSGLARVPTRTARCPRFTRVAVMAVCAWPADLPVAGALSASLKGFSAARFRTTMVARAWASGTHTRRGSLDRSQRWLTRPATAARSGQASNSAGSAGTKGMTSYDTSQGSSRGRREPTSRGGGPQPMAELRVHRPYQNRVYPHLASPAAGECVSAGARNPYPADLVRRGNHNEAVFDFLQHNAITPPRCPRLSRTIWTVGRPDADTCGST